jgi:hypothetical protein
MYSIKDNENLIIGCHRVDVPLIGIEKKERGLGFRVLPCSVRATI